MEYGRLESITKEPIEIAEEEYRKTIFDDFETLEIELAKTSELLNKLGDVLNPIRKRNMPKMLFEEATEDDTASTIGNRIQGITVSVSNINRVIEQYISELDLM